MFICFCSHRGYDRLRRTKIFEVIECFYSAVEWISFIKAENKFSYERRITFIWSGNARIFYIFLGSR